MYSLTETQAKLFAYIKAEIEAGRTAPSIRQMADYMDWKSTSRAHRVLSSLEERGAIKRLPERARAIKVMW